MFTNEIIENWDKTPKGHATKIASLCEQGYLTWTIKTQDGYGVAIPLPNDTEVSENFSGARIYNDIVLFENGEKLNSLILLSNLDEIRRPFATLCSELINPGPDGIFRKEIEKSPVTWWENWKELLGNRQVDERVYDVLGELCALKYLVERGENVIWNGPEASTYDIDGDSVYYEVKSTTSRKKRQITLSNQFQLIPPNGKELRLILCQFERAQSGYCIDDIVEELVRYGYSEFELNRKLKLLGLEKRKSSRKRCYDLHAMIMYKVDEEFPAIRESSFVGGCIPRCVESITYTLSLDGIEGQIL